MTPVALFVPEESPHGRVYHPANEIATRFAAIAGVTRLPEVSLQHIRDLGFEVAETNGTPILQPRKAFPRPRHPLLGV